METLKITFLYIIVPLLVVYQLLDIWDYLVIHLF